MLRKLKVGAIVAAVLSLLAAFGLEFPEGSAELITQLVQWIIESLGPIAGGLMAAYAVRERRDKAKGLKLID